MELPNSESGFFFVQWSLPVPDSEKVKCRDRDNCPPLPEQASLIFARPPSESPTQATMECTQIPLSLFY